jgi:hypothetical protein
MDEQNRQASRQRYMDTKFRTEWITYVVMSGKGKCGEGDGRDMIWGVGHG